MTMPPLYLKKGARSTPPSIFRREGNPRLLSLSRGE